MIGHPRVTAKAYASRTELRRAAVEFAESSVHNGLAPDHGLSDAAVTRLKAQIERDFLVHMTAADVGETAQRLLGKLMHSPERWDDDVALIEETLWELLL